MKKTNSSQNIILIIGIIGIMITIIWIALLERKIFVELEDDYYDSRLVQLKNGRECVFTGADKQFCIKDYLVEMKLVLSTDYDLKIQGAKVKTIAEKYQELFLNEIPPQETKLLIFYDLECKLIMFEHEYDEMTVIPGRYSVVVVDCQDGSIKRYSN